MADVSESSRTFLFSEHLHGSTPSHCSRRSRSAAAEESGLYGRGTDLGAALENCWLKAFMLGPSTTLLISDTKTVNKPGRAGPGRGRAGGADSLAQPHPGAQVAVYPQRADDRRARCAVVPVQRIEALSRACRHADVGGGFPIRTRDFARTRRGG